MDASIVGRRVRRGVLLLPGLTFLLLWALVTSPAANALPAGWGYELVSPSDTLGRDVTGGAMGPDGTHAWVYDVAPLIPTQSTGNAATLAASRSAKGWTVSELSDPSQPGNLQYVLVARSADSATALVSVCDATTLGCNGTIALQRIAAGSRTTVFTQPEVSTLEPQVAGMTDDLSRLAVQTPDDAPAILPDDTHTAGRGLYFVDDDQVEFVGVDEHGDVLPCGATLANNGSLSVGTGFGQSGMSSDGETLVYESPDPLAQCAQPIDIYVRHGSETRNVSAPRNATPDNGATFAGMSPDGNTVYFTTTNALVAADNNTTNDIYAYDYPTDSLTLVTPSPDPPASPPDVIDVEVSPNAESVYFTTNNAIAGMGSDGEQNFFVLHDGTITHIATTDQGFFFIGHAMNADLPTPLTPDGRHLLFYSQAPLTGQPTGGFLQLFQYDAQDSQIVCISCRPDGAPSTAQVTYSGMLPAGNVDQRIQSDDGNTVAFQSRERLLPGDINNAKDVYLWQGGVLSLISSGQDSSDDFLRGMSADGHTVLFTSSERLVQDVAQDNSKVYAARLGGGFPILIPPPLCSEDECQGLPTASPATPTASGSSTFIAPTRIHKRPRRLIKLGRLASRRASERAARTGMLIIPLRVIVPGRVNIEVAGRFDGRWSSIGKAARVVHRPASLRLNVRLSQRARGQLALNQTIHLRISVRHSSSGRLARRDVILRIGAGTRKG